jgi:hypothetical protein
VTSDGEVTELVVEFTQRFRVIPSADIDDQVHAGQWFWNTYDEIGRDILDSKNSDNYAVIEVRRAGGDD